MQLWADADTLLKFALPIRYFVFVLDRPWQSLESFMAVCVSFRCVLQVTGLHRMETCAAPVKMAKTSQLVKKHLYKTHLALKLGNVVMIVVVVVVVVLITVTIMINIPSTFSLHC